MGSGWWSPGLATREGCVHTNLLKIQRSSFGFCDPFRHWIRSGYGSGQTFKETTGSSWEGIGFWHSGGAAWTRAKRRCVSTPYS